MKKSLSFLFALFLCAGLFAQEFQKGDKVLNLGLGLGTSLYSGGLYKTTIPPLSASFEVGVKDDVGPGNIGVGGYLGIAGSKYEWSGYGYNYGYKYTYFVLGARGTYHLNMMPEKLDVYGGIMPYFAIVSSSEYGTYSGTWGGAESSHVGASIFAGARYYFTEKFAAMAELGYGVSYLNIGVALKF